MRDSPLGKTNSVDVDKEVHYGTGNMGSVARDR